MSVSPYAFLGFPVFTKAVASEYLCSFWVDNLSPSFQGPSYDFDLNLGPNNPNCAPADLQCESPYPGQCLTRTTVGDWKHGRYVGGLYAYLEYAKGIDMDKAWEPEQWGYDPVELMTVLLYDGDTPGDRFCGYLVERLATPQAGKAIVRVVRPGSKDAPSPKNRTIVELDDEDIFVPSPDGPIEACLRGDPPAGCERMFIRDRQPTLMVTSNSGGGKVPISAGY